MIRRRDPQRTPVPREEVMRRIAEARQIAFDHRMPPVVVYPPHFHRCPWAGCDYRIVGMKMKLEDLGPAEFHEAWLNAFWRGPGLLAQCPGCHRYVLFDVEGKKAVTDPEPIGVPPLPDDWYERSHLSPAEGLQSA
jgi:hypothetical protein